MPHAAYSTAAPSAVTTHCDGGGGDGGRGNGGGDDGDGDGSGGGVGGRGDGGKMVAEDAVQ